MQILTHSSTSLHECNYVYRQLRGSAHNKIHNYFLFMTFMVKGLAYKTNANTATLRLNGRVVLYYIYIAGLTCSNLP